MSQTINLKRYTQFKYLESTLEKASLWAGNPKYWPDQNDAFTLRLFCEKKGYAGARVLCMTPSADRYHFWKEYGGEDCVCLWFDRKVFLSNLIDEKDVTVRDVRYPSDDIFKHYQLSDLPFVKRQQYADERELRIARFKDDDFAVPFRKNSLRAIYLSAELDRTSMSSRRTEIRDWLSKFGYSHVKVLQSRMLNKANWQKIAERVAEKGSV